MVDLRNLLRVVPRGDFLCLPCIAGSLAIEPTEAEQLMQRLVLHVTLKDLVGTCPACRTGPARLFSLG